MRLGALVLQEEPWDQAALTWRQVEAVGFDAGYVADHLTHSTVAGRWWADGWTTLAAAAGVTDRLLLGPLVASAAIRSPAALARASATLQDISGGRFMLGLGAGVVADVRADRGVAPTPVALWERYVEVVSAIRALWGGSQGWRGDHLCIDGIEPLPHAPAQTAPPLVLAAHARHGFDLVARQGDGWNTYGGPGIAGLRAEDMWEVLSHQSQEVSRACERIAREPGSLHRSVLLGYGTHRPLASVSALVESVERAEQLGFDEVVVYWPRGERGGRFWADLDVVVDAIAKLRS
jgi:alkanesulfonate monooxygenase SsuD/methylene tetrahydromethanopterin reductase-like flavin-dependent oxidoreductase (luciferase family)